MSSGTSLLAFMSFWHSTMSVRTLSEREAELVFMLGSVQQKGCSRDKYSRLTDLEMIPALRMEVFYASYSSW